MCPMLLAVLWIGGAVPQEAEPVWGKADQGVRMSVTLDAGQVDQGGKIGFSLKFDVDQKAIPSDKNLVNRSSENSTLALLLTKKGEKRPACIPYFRGGPGGPSYSRDTAVISLTGGIPSVPRREVILVPPEERALEPGMYEVRATVEYRIGGWIYDESQQERMCELKLTSQPVELEIQAVEPTPIDVSLPLGLDLVFESYEDEGQSYQMYGIVSDHGDTFTVGIEPGLVLGYTCELMIAPEGRPFGSGGGSEGGVEDPLAWESPGRSGLAWLTEEAPIEDLRLLAHLEFYQASPDWRHGLLRVLPIASRMYVIGEPDATPDGHFHARVLWRLARAHNIASSMKEDGHSVTAFDYLCEGRHPDHERDGSTVDSPTVEYTKLSVPGSAEEEGRSVVYARVEPEGREYILDGDGLIYSRQGGAEPLTAPPSAEVLSEWRAENDVGPGRGW